jgi:hypothetical protein
MQTVPGYLRLVHADLELTHGWDAGGRGMIRIAFVLVALGVAFSSTLWAEGPMIPPTVARISPAGMQRGSTVSFTIEGRSLSDATGLIFDAPGLSAKITQISDVPEKITGPRAGEDLEAQVPLGKKQTATVEITASKDTLAGIHRFRVKTPLGTSNMVALAVGMLPEIKRREETGMSSGAPPQPVQLPATLTGTIGATGEKHTYQFEGKAGEEIVCRVQASTLGSKLTSLLVLSDSSGQVIATSAEDANKRDAALTYKLPQNGQYNLVISDRNLAGGGDYFYRVDAGDLPYITGVFPLGVRTGQSAEISIKGVNLGGAGTAKLVAPANAEGWTTMPLELVGAGIRPVNEVRLAIGNEPEIPEQEPNDTIARAQSVSLPVTINGHLEGGIQRGGNPDEDYFRFHARKGERLSIDVASARLGSALDSVIEVLDAQGNAIPRATIRCLNETTTTLADRDSRTDGIRLLSTSGLREGDYLMVGDELDRIDFIPDQPDADTNLKAMGGLRVAYLGTSPDVHAVNTPVYKAQILPPDAEFPSNGLPVFHLNWRNDDGGPGYDADSKLDFVAPADGDYLLHLKDLRNMEGPDFAYRLTIHNEVPDFKLRAEPANPNIPRGGSMPVMVSLDAIRGVDGPIEIQMKGLPKGVSASPATILPGQFSTIVLLSAAADAALDGPAEPIRITGRAMADGREIVRTANRSADADAPLQLASVIPSQDVVVTTDSKQVSLEPGKDVTVTLNVERRNGFKGRVPCLVENLPPGIRVVNVGLNGVLVTEAQSSRTFTLHAEDWAQPAQQHIYVVGTVESNSPTRHPSAPLLLKVAEKQTARAQNQPANRDR